MRINENGHVVSDTGETTNPLKTAYWVGDDNKRIAFDFMILPTEEVVLHSIYGSIDDQACETFLYEVVPLAEAYDSASGMLSCATNYLTEQGVKTIKSFGFLLLEDLEEALNI